MSLRQRRLSPTTVEKNSATMMSSTISHNEEGEDDEDVFQDEIIVENEQAEGTPLLSASSSPSMKKQKINKKVSSSPSSKKSSLFLSSTTGKDKVNNAANRSFDANGYTIIPLQQRSILFRLDVGPFLMMYLFLVALDYSFQDIDNNLLWTIVSQTIFPIALISHLSLFLLQQWKVETRAKVGFYFCLQKHDLSFKDWTHCLVQAPLSEQHTTAVAAICPIQYAQHALVVNFQDVIFRYRLKSGPDDDVSLWSSSGTKNFAAVSVSKALDDTFHRVQYPIHLSLSFYAQWKGHANVSQIVKAQQLYGDNTTPISLPSFWELLAEQLVAPFFLFQVLCVILWSLDEYWYYAIFTFCAILMFESTLAYNRLQSLSRLRATMEDTVHDRLWVYRPSSPSKHDWIQVFAPELVPGDIVSIRAQQQLRRYRDQEPKHTRIPADMVLVQGDAVCDEALLTGESIPQLKVALEGSTENGQKLDLQDHKQSILFGGTNILVSNSGGGGAVGSGTNISSSNASIPPAPDQGAIGMVLRTGFETAQGSLLRTMAHSQKSVDGIHTHDTFVFIFLLLICAIASASMVCMDGWNDPTRNRFRLVLHVIIIVTSVVPPELPMELSLAVTNSLADLMRRCQVYCTEVFRIPLAGQVTVCCFDKTGTLTSDEMKFKGVRLIQPNTNEFSHSVIAPPADIQSHSTLTMDDDGNVSIPWSLHRIMVACHSLALSNGNTVIGDPLEKAVFSQSGYRLWQNNTIRRNPAMFVNTNDPTNPSSTAPLPATVIVLHRFGFSSKLKRMTVLIKEIFDHETTFSPLVWALSKGAPEVIQQYCKPESLPDNYNEVYQYHMGRGQRVLAVAYRKIVEDANNRKSIAYWKEQKRETIERDLIFCGFLLLDCPLKSDSGSVISELRHSGHEVVMITGDAVLTAAEVARQVGIIAKQDNVYPRSYEVRVQDDNDEEEEDETEGNSGDFNDDDDYSEKKINENSLVSKNGGNDADPLAKFCFVPLNSNPDDQVHEGPIPLTYSNFADLRQMVQRGEFAFCISGDVLAKIALAVVSHAERDKNTTNNASAVDEKHVLLHPAAQVVLKDLVPLISVFARHAPRQKEAVVAAFNLGGFLTLMCGDGTNDVGALRRAHVGISIISAPGVEAKQRSATEAIKAEQKRERKAQKKKKKQASSGSTSSGGTSSSSSRQKSSSSSTIEESLRKLQEAQEELDHVELGDASVASPFTSRAVSIKCCKDVLQQGRCTLVTMLQIYKILGINCLVNAMVLSTLFLHGVKQGDRQLTVLGIAIAGLFLFVTRGKPLSTLSPIRPPSSVLCAQALISITIQFCIHFGTILIVADIALLFVDPYDPSMIPDGPFNPNTLNTCTFLMSAVATITTFAVNYRGRPFMEDLKDNTLLLRSLQVCYGVLFICALEVFPPLNDLLQLSTFPTIEQEAEWRSGKNDTSNDEVNTTTIYNGFLLSSLSKMVEQVGFPIFMCVLMVTDIILAVVAERLVVKYFEGKE